jgi:hypothetical protein
MLTGSELALLIVNWKTQTGTEINGRMCVPYDSKIRVPMYKDLIATLITNYHYDKSDLFAVQTVNLILEGSTNPESPNLRKLKDLALIDWQRALVEEFPTEVLKHSGEVNVSRRVENKPQEPEIEIEPVDLGPLALDQEEFDYLTGIVRSSFEIDFLADMLTVHLSQMTKKQEERLNKLRKKVKTIQRVKDREPERVANREEEQEAAEASMVKENPLDRSIFEGLPPVVDPIDEDFLNLINSVGGNND